MLAAAAAACEDDGAPPPQPPPTTAAPSTTAATTDHWRRSTTTSTTTLPATDDDTPPNRSPVVRSAAVVEGFAAAWAAEDPDAPLRSLRGRGARATTPKAGVASSTRAPSTACFMASWVRGAFAVALTSYFVSSDGRFAATLGTFSEQDESGNLAAGARTPRLLAFESDTDRAGCTTTTAAQMSLRPSRMPRHPAAARSTRASPEAQTATRGSDRLTIEQWIARTTTGTPRPSCPTTPTKPGTSTLVGPDWRVMTKAELAADVASHFPRAEFESRLEPSFGSVIDSFFVSADAASPPCRVPMEHQGTISASRWSLILEIDATAPSSGSTTSSSSSGDLLQP